MSLTGDRSSGSLSAAVFRHLEELGPLKEAWRELADASGQPYGTPEWMWAWWAHAAPRGALLRVIAVSRGDRTLGIAPFFAESRAGVHRYRILGAGVSARVDILARPGDEEAVAGPVAACLSSENPRPDAVLFEGTRRESPWPRLLADTWPARSSPRLYREYALAAPCLDLPLADFDAWFAARSGHFRARMRRGLRKLAEQGGTIRHVSDPGEIERYVSEFARLHRLRWASRGGSGVLTGGVERALKEAASGSVGVSPVQLWVVDMPQGTISVQVFLQAGTELGYWLGGFDAAGHNLRPGPALLTLIRVIDRAHATGVVTLDLGPGGQPYKAEFANRTQSLDWSALCISRAKTPAVRLSFVAARARHAALHKLSPGFKRHLRRLQRRLVRSPDPRS